MMEDGGTFLTPEALAKLQEELEELKTNGRREIEERMTESRSHGDIRENADYDAAKNEQAIMEARIRQLQHLVETAQITKVEDTGRVEIGSVVTVVDSDGDEIDYFVAPQENKISGLIPTSPTSPLGSALLGSSVGDEVAYKAPAGSFTVKIKAVRPYTG